MALFVGRIEYQKGLNFLLDAFERVSYDFPTWTLAIVGDGPDLAEFKAEADGSPVLRERVLWLGRRSDVDMLLRVAEFLVLPSLWEGMPNVVLEAMAARKTVVATRVEGTEDLVVGDGPDQTGWLVPPWDDDSLADAIRQAMGDADRRSTFGERGRRRIERHFTFESVVAAYEDVWAGCLGLDLGRGRPVREFGLKPRGEDAR